MRISDTEKSSVIFSQTNNFAKLKSDAPSSWNIKEWVSEWVRFVA